MAPCPRPPASYTVQQLSADDGPLMTALLGLFGEAFDNLAAYGASRPRPAYLRQLLGSDYSLHWPRARGRKSSAASQPTS